MLKNTSTPHPTAAELDLLRILWQRGPSDARAVYDALAAERADASYATVLRQLQLMHGKGLLSRDDYTRKKALELLDLFRRHDGQPYDDENHIIDIHALLREVENAKQGKVAPESRGIER